ncbi:MAG TPA: rod shape-determining protein RodA [Spongiibacteraceae bacterium]|nr:rod shape-determining protein RodA [Spongiibacteraceae bacterium]
MTQRDFVRQMPNIGLRPSATPGLWRRLHLDPWLLLLLVMLSIGGLVVLYSASGQDLDAVLRQGRFFLIAFAVMLFMAQLDPERIKRVTPFVYVGGVGLLVAVLVMGTDAKGAQRWLSVGGFRFQPSEIMKLVVPMAAAWYLSARTLPPRFKHVGVALVLVALPAALIVRQPDLGTAILIAASGLFVLFLAGVAWKLIFSALGLAVLGSWPLWHFVMHDYQRQRVLTLLNPESDKLGAGWNIIQSKTAIGSGGWAGKGWLHGTQSHLDFLPESHTDFIIAVLAEEFGLRGVLVLLALYLLVILRSMWIASQAQHCFGRLLAGSIVLTYFVYVFVNMGMVSGLLPVVGVPLPLVSQGGTALVTLLAGFGLLMAIGTEKRVLT